MELPQERVAQPLPLVEGVAGEEAAAAAAPARARRSRGEPRAAASPAAPEVPEVPFEQAIAELERIVRDLEAGDLGLDDALRLYERGVALARGCAAQLAAAEARLRVLALDGEGRPVLAPLEDEGA